MYLLILLIILILLGIADSVYLIYKNKPNKRLICPLNSNCHVVLKSKWNKFLGVKNEIWGFLYYLGVLGLVGLFVYNIIVTIEMLMVVVGFGVLYSAFLTYIQIFTIKEYCLYCLFSALINVFLLAVIVFM